MAHQHFGKRLETLAEELEPFLGPTVFELDFVDHRAPWGDPAVLSPGHGGCYLAVTGTSTKFSTITFELRLDLTPWGKSEVLVVQGHFIDMRYPGERYERWFNSPYAHPYMLDIYDRVDRMAAYALRLLEKYSQESLGNPQFELIPAISYQEISAVIEYFRVPVQIDYHG